MILIDGRVVDQHVDAAGLGNDGVDESRHGRRVGQIAGHEGVRPAGQGGQRRLGRGPVAMIVDGHARAVLGEELSDGPADAARRAGDENNLVSEIEHGPIVT